MQTLSSNRSFDGWHQRFEHRSNTLDCTMQFAVYLPPQAEHEEVPVLWWLSGLTCTDENFMQKAGAHRLASQLGLAIVCPDTSPRGTNLPGEHDDYDLGSGAGFYLNASQAPWNSHYRMFDYVTEELPALVRQHLPIGSDQSICGHSMGGHGALICALKKPGNYHSVSAFAPISNPSRCDWGRKAFTAYLGEDCDAWKTWDACELIRTGYRVDELLIDQGEADHFLQEGQLQPEALEKACAEAGIPLNLRMQTDYDHSYFFIASFIDEHLRYHASRLGKRDA